MAEFIIPEKPTIKQRLFLRYHGFDDGAIDKLTKAQAKWEIVHLKMKERGMKNE